ncbi:MAG: vitamin K epoxide reductase family protein [Chloroflexi bacterium]|nr:vitamin K epoxide reductase family protein [Chloroflexota bacterium]MBI4507246.1 vitamin K epoxide reductase family protein [Chloroflexota bacterium]
MTDLAIALLSLLGLAIASLFTLAAYGLATQRLGPILAVCRLDEQTCRRIVDTPQARALGLPNSVYGLAYYLVLVAGLGLGWWHPGSTLLGSAVLVAWATVVLAAYLAYALLAVLRVPCVLCLASHTINLALALLLSVRWLGWV